MVLPKVFDRLKYRVTTTAGGGATLHDVIAAGVENLDTPIGVFAPDPNSYRSVSVKKRSLICS